MHAFSDGLGSLDAPSRKGGVFVGRGMDGLDKIPRERDVEKD